MVGNNTSTPSKPGGAGQETTPAADLMSAADVASSSSATTRVDFPSSIISSSSSSFPIQEHYDVLQSDCLNVPASNLIGAIDQENNSTRFVVFTKKGNIASSSKMTHKQYYPQTGYHKHDPIELWDNTVLCMKAVYDQLLSSTHGVEQNNNVLDGIGVINR
jgi:FGGY family of carbohydrate kinases, N-terminal domain